MRWIFAAAEFIRTFRRQLRFGDRSRLPLKLVRLELREGYAECEWIARRDDPWDVDVAPVVREQSETWQTLRDALSVREVLFASIPQLQVAMLKVYRQRETCDPELIIAGKREPGRQPAAREFFAHGGSTLRIPILPGGRSSSASGNPQSTAIRN